MLSPWPAAALRPHPPKAHALEPPTPSNCMPMRTTLWPWRCTTCASPADVLQKIHGAIARALKNPVVRDKYAAAGAITVIDSPEDFSRIITNDVAKWKTVVKDSAITVD